MNSLFVFPCNKQLLQIITEELSCSFLDPVVKLQRANLVPYLTGANSSKRLKGETRLAALNLGGKGKKCLTLDELFVDGLFLDQVQENQGSSLEIKQCINDRCA